jgi:hypothetical protein
VYGAAEQWILTRLSNGNDADLKSWSQKSGRDPRISGSFLANLLAGTVNSTTISWRGIHIRNATVVGKLDLNGAGATVPYEVELVNCTFGGPVNLTGTRFAKNLSLARSIFRRSVTFDHTSIAGILDLRNADFSETGRAGVRFNALKVATESGTPTCHSRYLSSVAHGDRSGYGSQHRPVVHRCHQMI